VALPEKLERMANELVVLWNRGKTAAMDAVTSGLNKRQASLVWRRAQRVAIAGE
jgi:hypothetical protein